jgi:predicted RNA binding protein YcfA (HicA-like mRNA interferase family)
VSRHEKLKERVLSGAADAAIRFEDLCFLLTRLGFVERHGSGSHRIYRMDGVEEILNIQPKSGKAKPYQVKQVRQLIQKYGL